MTKRSWNCPGLTTCLVAGMLMSISATYGQTSTKAPDQAPTRAPDQAATKTPDQTPAPKAATDGDEGPIVGPPAGPALPAFHASAQDTKAALKGVAQGYAKMARAISHMDAATYRSVETPDFVNIDEHGNEQRGHVPTDPFALARSYSHRVKMTTTITSFELQADGAVAQIKEQFILNLSNPSTNRAATVVVEAISRDFWVKTRSGWRQKRSRMLNHHINTVLSRLPG